MKLKLIYFFIIIFIVFGNPLFFDFLPESPIIPMLTHYFLISIFAYLGYKETIKYNRWLLLAAISVIVLWHLPWLFDISTKNIVFWDLDVSTISLSSIALGSSLKYLKEGVIIFLFSLWMLGESFLSYFWIVNPSLYSRPFSIYYQSQFPLAGTIMFLVMNLIGVYVILKLLFSKVFNEKSTQM